MSKAHNGGRGNAFWDERRLKSLRAMKSGGADHSLMRERFRASKDQISKGLAIIAAEDAAKAQGECA